jgi:hypothetical protein
MRIVGTLSSMALLLVLPLLTAGEAGAPSKTVEVDFEKDDVGQAPKGFSIAQTGGGDKPKWVIKQDPDAPKGKRVLAQVDPDPTDDRYPLCVYDAVTARDVDVTVAFKPVAGEVDQAAGIVVRYKDKDNYYMARANSLEGNVRLYRIVDGKRKQFAGEKVQVPSGKWQTLRLTAVGNHFEVMLGDARLFAADDDTIKGPGKVGLWTKADSVTHFDHLRVVVRDAK